MDQSKLFLKHMSQFAGSIYDQVVVLEDRLAEEHALSLTEHSQFYGIEKQLEKLAANIRDFYNIV